MELHLALKHIITTSGPNIIEDPQIINHLLDYRCFVDKPAMKLILRDIINSGYATEILALNQSQPAWQTKFKHYVHDFIDACGYREELATYVFESIAYALGLNVYDEEPRIRRQINVDSFFDISGEDEQVNPSSQPPPIPQKSTVDPKDAYTIALSFFNESKYLQAKAFIEKAINNVVLGDIPANYYKLMGDILMMSNDFEGAIGNYNKCLKYKAKEKKITVYQLRGALKNHEVKGYENFIFSYFYCLYFSNKISEEKWLKILKKEARLGSLYALQFCVQHGIDPVENHIDIFFTDRSKLKTNDYLYEDGTFAHEYSTSKKAIARICITETTEYDKSKGWNTGYIIALSCDSNFETPIIKEDVEWSTINVDEKFPHSHYTVDDINHWDELEKIDAERLIQIKLSDMLDYPAFRAAYNYNVKIPIVGASNWFLPSVILLEHLKKEGLFFGLVKEVWTSSQADRHYALAFRDVYSKYFLSRYEKQYKCGIILVAAF